MCKQNNKIITKGEKLQNLYYLPIKVIKDQVLNISTNSTNDTSINNLIWHQRLGHINNECIKQLHSSTLGSNTTNTSILLTYWRK